MVKLEFKAQVGTMGKQKVINIPKEMHGKLLGFLDQKLNITVTLEKLQ